MRSERHVSYLIAPAVLLMFAGGISSFAQDGKLILHVTPKQAYVFV